MALASRTTVAGMASAQQARERTVRVLVAEDQREMRVLMSEVLRREGYEVLEAASGTELIDRLVTGLIADDDARAPDLIVTDVRMPGCTGLEVLARLRRNDWSTPVILITAFGDPATHEEAHRLGAAYVLDKPFELDDLVLAALSLAHPRRR
jgi:CheY-like chemotaxis protein